MLVAVGNNAKPSFDRCREEYAAELAVVRAAAGALDVFATLSTAAGPETDRETTTKIGSSSGVSLRGSVCLSGYVLELAAKGTYYLKLQDGAGFDLGDRVQGQRAENEGEGGVRVFVIDVSAKDSVSQQKCAL